MARSAYIYHLYQNNKRIVSATVKAEILSTIHTNFYTGTEFNLTVSGDNYIGESEVLGWRHQPVVGNYVVRIDGFCYKVKKVDSLNASGNWSVEVEECGKMMIRFNEDLKQFEEYEPVRKSKRTKE